MMGSALEHRRRVGAGHQQARAAPRRRPAPTRSPRRRRRARAVVEPLDLVVDRARLGRAASRCIVARSSTWKRHVPHAAPARLLVGDAGAVRRQRRALDVLVDHRARARPRRCPRSGRSCRPSRASRRSGRRPAAKVTPQKLTSGASTALPSFVTLQLLEVAERLAGRHVDDQRRRVENAPGVV